jgi:uncharacterized membrane protein
MDQTHLHLLITHLPIVGSILGAIVLAYGLSTKTMHTSIAAYLVLIISSIGAFIANQTGEAAEETIEHLQGISENLIHEHEESAEIALIAMIALAILSLLALFASYKKSPYSYSLGWITLIVSLISFGIIARTGYLGGQIRHTEIHTNTGVQENGADQEEN